MRTLSLLTPPLSPTGFAYFLRGRDYWKFDPVQVKVLEGYPRQISQDFFSCTPPSNSFR